MSRRVLCGLKPAPLLIWMGLFLAIPTYALHEDLTSDGLRRTQAFLVLGYLIYPMFYGCILFVLYRFTLMFLHRGDYVTLSDGSVTFGRTTVPLNDVLGVDVQRNWLGLEQLVLVRKEGADYRLAGYALSRPVAEVAADLKAVLPTQTPR